MKQYDPLKSIQAAIVYEGEAGMSLAFDDGIVSGRNAGWVAKFTWKGRYGARNKTLTARAQTPDAALRALDGLVGSRNCMDAKTRADVR